MLTALVLALAAVSPSGIHWMEDDLSGALKKGKAENKLVFVDAWATWCHSCLSMQRFVFVDPGLKAVKDTVVWAAIETESEKNRDFTDKYPVEGLPTFLLVDPNTGEVAGRWLGSGSVNELRAFVHDGAAEWSALRKGAKLTEAQTATRAGHAAQQKGDKPGAVEAYRKAVKASAKNDPARAERLDQLTSALDKLGTKEALQECVDLSTAELPAMPATAVGADFAIVATSCADKLAKEKVDTSAIKKASMARLSALVDDPKASLSADDKSDILANLASLHEDAKELEQATAVMQRRAKLLEDAAAKAPDFVLAATFDAHRTDTYLWLKEPQKAADLLTQRMKEMPTDYNPQARLARVLFEQKKLPEAEAMVDGALAKMTKGPRRIGVLGLKGKILVAQGKSNEPVLKEQLEVLRALPATQKRPEQEKKIEQDLKTLGAKAER